MSCFKLHKNANKNTCRYDIGFYEMVRKNLTKMNTCISEAYNNFTLLSTFESEDDDCIGSIFIEDYYCKVNFRYLLQKSVWLVLFLIKRYLGHNQDFAKK